MTKFAALSLHSQSYLPPAFSESGRIENIQAAMPAVDTIYKEYAEKNHFPGFAYGILVDGQLAYAGSGGFADIERKIPVTSQSMFRIASLTKSFTAMAILHLRDAGKLRLDDPVENYIPEFQGRRLTQDAPVITIRDLLTHSAGLPTDDPWADRKLDDTDDDLSAFLKNGFFFSQVPQTSYEYSNLGYALLGRIIAKVTGSTCARYIDETFALKDIVWDCTSVSEPQRVEGYAWRDETWNKEEQLSDGVFGPMGGLLASIESFSQYVSWHLTAWPPRDDAELAPIKRSSLREMHQPWRFRDLVVDTYPDGRVRACASAYGYGLAWMRDNQGRVYIGHNGGLPGFGSNWYIMPEYGIGVILFANATYAPAYKVNLEVLDTLIRDAKLTPRRLLPSEILTSRKNALVQLLPQWDWANKSDIFAENFFLDNAIRDLQMQTNTLFARMGRILSVGEVVPQNQLRGHFVVKGEHFDVIVRFSLTPDTHIQELQMQEIML